MKTANLSPIVRATIITDVDVQSILNEVGYRTDKVDVEIFGISFKYTEPQLRALQLLVARTSKDNPEEGRNLCDNIKIYYAYGYHREVHILPDGRLDNMLPGFLDVNDNLSIDLLTSIPDSVG